MYLFYGVLSFLVPTIGAGRGLFLTRVPVEDYMMLGLDVTPRSRLEIIRRPNEMKEDLLYAQLSVDYISCCCVKAFHHSIVYVSGTSECQYILTLRGIFS